MLEPKTNKIHRNGGIDEGPQGKFQFIYKKHQFENSKMIIWGITFNKLKLNYLGTPRHGFCSFLKMENWENHLGC